MFEFALCVRTLRYRTGLQVLLNEITAAALRALLRNRFSPCHEIAVRIAIAAVESSSAFRTALHNLAFRTVRARHSDRFLFYVLTRRIVAARHKLAIPAEFLN